MNQARKQEDPGPAPETETPGSPANAEPAGVIGLGIIGSRVAERVRQSGRKLYVWNRSPKPTPGFVASPAEMARLAPLIQIFVADGEALRGVMGSLAPELGTEHLVINCSTVDPASTAEAYRIAKEAGAAFLDCPFTGSKEAAAAGSLVYYVGGSEEALRRARPLLALSSKEILPVGRIGEASLLKIATNMISATTVEVLAEAYGLVRAAGIEPEKLRAAVELNACGSPLASMKLPSIVAGDYETHFSLKHMFKDARYAIDLSKEFDIDLPALTATANLMYRAIQKGHGERDYSVLAARYQEGGQQPKR